PRRASNTILLPIFARQGSAHHLELRLGRSNLPADVIDLVPRPPGLFLGPRRLRTDQYGRPLGRRGQGRSCFIKCFVDIRHGDSFPVVAASRRYGLSEPATFRATRTSLLLRAIVSYRKVL